MLYKRQPVLVKTFIRTFYWNDTLLFFKKNLLITPTCYPSRFTTSIYKTPNCLIFAIAHLNSVAFLTENVFRIMRVLIYLRIRWVQPKEYKEEEGGERNDVTCKSSQSTCKYANLRCWYLESLILVVLFVADYSVQQWYESLRLWFVWLIKFS